MFQHGQSFRVKPFGGPSFNFGPALSDGRAVKPNIWVLTITYAVLGGSVLELEL